MRVFQFTTEKTKSNGVVVKKYIPVVPVYIMSMNIESGEFSEKRVLEYSVHENIKMYKITSCFFKTFWASEDHSLVVYDIKCSIYKKVRPIDVTSDHYFVKYNQGKKMYIASTMVNIELDPNLTVGYDFTVEDNYTFLTDDGIVVQDTMAVYTPIVSPRELYVENNLVDPNLKPFELTHEYVVAIYQLTETEEGQKVVADIIGLPVEKIGRVDKKKLDQLVYEISLTRPAAEVIDIIYKLQKLVGCAEITLSLEDFDLDVDTSDLADLPNEEKVKRLLERTKEAGKKSKNLSAIIDSGSRGKWIQVQQVSTAKGVVVDALNRPVGYVDTPYIKGLNEKEVMLATHGTRKGLLDTAIQTSKSGELFRKLIYTTIDITADYNQPECGTDTLMSVNITEKNYNSFRLRVANINGKDVVIDDPKKYIGQTIDIYTPLGCKAKHLCSKCCGPVIKLIKTKYIGTVAAQSIGERCTQLVLRSFHISGTAEKLKGDTNVDIVTDLSSLEKLLNKEDPTLSVEEFISSLQFFVEEYKILHLWLEILTLSLFRDHKYNTIRHSEYATKRSMKSVIDHTWLRGLCFGWAKDRIRDGIMEEFKLTEISPLEELLFI